MNVCPECKSKIYNPQASFCYKCGFRLNEVEASEQGGFPDEKEGLVKTPAKKSYENVDTTMTSSISIDKSEIPPETHPKKTPDLNKRWGVFVIGVNAISIMFLIVAVGLFFRSASPSSGQSITPMVELNVVEINDDVGELFDTNVMKNNYYKIAPKSTLLYAESSNLEDFISKFLSDEQKKYLEDTYELKFDDFMVFLGVDYGYIKDSSGDSAVIVQVSGFDFFERTYSKYQDNKSNDAPIITKRVGEFLVFSTSNDLINEFDEVITGTNSSLEQNPSFSLALKSVTEKPVLFVYTDPEEYGRENINDDLDVLGLEFLDDEASKTTSSAFYVVKEGSKYIVKEAK